MSSAVHSFLLERSAVMVLTELKVGPPFLSASVDSKCKEHFAALSDHYKTKPEDLTLAITAEKTLRREVAVVATGVVAMVIEKENSGVTSQPIVLTENFSVCCSRQAVEPRYSLLQRLRWHDARKCVVL